MSEKQDRQGVRTASDLERKYQFGKQFAEVLGVALDARDSVDRIESELRSEILEQVTSLTRSAEEIILSALKSYVETSGYEEFKSTLKAELEVWAEGITGRVSATERNVENVDSDLQSKFNTITKYFTFNIDGLTIGQADNPNRVVLDNDEITIFTQGIPVQQFKVDGTSLIPILTVSKAMNCLGLRITEDETHINCDYYKGVGE